MYYSAKQTNGSGQWKVPKLFDCPPADEASRELQNLAEKPINNGNAFTVVVIVIAASVIVSTTAFIAASASKVYFHYFL